MPDNYLPGISRLWHFTDELHDADGLGASDIFHLAGIVLVFLGLFV